MTISVEEVRANFEYCPDTGLFKRLLRRGQPIKGAAKETPGVAMGQYFRICMGQQVFLAHRIAWLYMTGEFPDGVIDHINGNPSDNRWCNLRCVTQKENSQNVYKAKKNSKSGLLGAHFSKVHRRWVAQIRVNGKTKQIGAFDDAQSAHQAYIAEKRRLHEGNRL